MSRRALAALLLAAAACASTPPIPVEPGGSVAVEPASALAFQERADAFYQRLIRRRFNALETFNDAYLRQHFRTTDRFIDYYAGLSTALAEANFEKSRPTGVAVEELVFESPSSVVVLVRFRGEDDRPLRPTSVSLVRLDRWERSEDSWWLLPGKL